MVDGLTALILNRDEDYFNTAIESLKSLDNKDFNDLAKILERIKKVEKLFQKPEEGKK